VTRLGGKTAVVTGGSRGIGGAIAERLAAEGAGVTILHFDDEAQATTTLERIRAAGGIVRAINADIRDSAAVTRSFANIEQIVGQIDIVVANAGVNMNRPVVDTTDADFDRIFDVNARGSFFTLREAARRVAEGGRIVAVSTNMTLQSRAGTALYAGSKAAVEQFVRILARELGERRVTVNAIAPGPTNTTMVSQLSRDIAPGITPLGRLGEPRDIAAAVAWLASDDADWVTGQVIGVNGGIV
jgi:3-oxoacyl-[acyl-carrier protein] reductase